MSALEIAVVKGATHDSIEVRRTGGATARFTFPKKGPIPHDCVHLIVEGAVGLKRGFWGMVAEGVAPTEIQEIAKAGGHASASRAQPPAPEVVELIQAERLVECFEAEFWGTPADHETFREIAATACGHSYVPCPPLGDDLIALARERIAAFGKEWMAAPISARFDFSWPV